MNDDWNKYKDHEKVEQAEGWWKGLPMWGKAGIVIGVIWLVSMFFGGGGDVPVDPNSLIN